MKWWQRRYGIVLLTILACNMVLIAAPQKARAEVLNNSAERTNDLIVMLQSEVGIGAGIIFGRRDDQVYIATANHVVRAGTREAKDVQVMLRGLPGQWLKATLLQQADQQLDLAVLRVQGLASRGITFCTLPLDRLGDIAAVQRGDTVFPVGYPNAVRWGMPLTPDRIAQVVGDEIAFQSTFIARGHSGGGLMTEQGDLIGMIVGDSPPFGRATNLETLLKKLRQWGYPVQFYRATNFVRPPLHEAIEKGDLAEARRLIEACAYLNTLSDAGRTPLHVAASKGRADIAQLLLEAGADVMARTNEPFEYEEIQAQTPLHLAATSGSAAVAKVLLAHGADVNAIAQDIFGRDWGGAPLHRAAVRGSLEVMALLLAHAADLEAFSDGGTPLALTARHGQVEAMKVLIAHGADVNTQVFREVPLYLAADHGQVEATRVLLAAHANVDIQGSFGTPLHRAAQKGHVDIVRLLLEAGAQVNTTTVWGDTPLHQAVREGQREVVTLLLEAGADVMARDHRHQTPLALAKSEAMKALLSSAGRGWLGVETRDVTTEIAAHLGLQLTGGVLIVDVAPSSPADKAGLKADDIILAYEGHPIRTKDLVALVRQTSGGTKAQLKVFRQGEVVMVTVQMGERPN